MTTGSPTKIALFTLLGAGAILAVHATPQPGAQEPNEFAPTTTTYCYKANPCECYVIFPELGQVCRSGYLKLNYCPCPTATPTPTPTPTPPTSTPPNDTTPVTLGTDPGMYRPCIYWIGIGHEAWLRNENCAGRIWTIRTAGEADPGRPWELVYPRLTTLSDPDGSFSVVMQSDSRSAPPNNWRWQGMATDTTIALGNSLWLYATAYHSGSGEMRRAIIDWAVTNGSYVLLVELTDKHGGGDGDPREDYLGYWDMWPLGFAYAVLPTHLNGPTVLDLASITRKVIRENPGSGLRVDDPITVTHYSVAVETSTGGYEEALFSDLVLRRTRMFIPAPAPTPTPQVTSYTVKGSTENGIRVYGRCFTTPCEVWAGNRRVSSGYSYVSALIHRQAGDPNPLHIRVLNTNATYAYIRRVSDAERWMRPLNPEPR